MRAPPRTVFDEDFIRDRIMIDPNSGCWLWEKALINGYGVFTIRRGEKKTTKQAHRASYEHFVGPIPEGYQVDHLCKVTYCCNPKHLEAVTPRENVLRSDNYIAVNTRKTHCVNGHELSGHNLVMRHINRTARGPTVERGCRACHNATQKRFLARKKMEA